MVTFYLFLLLVGALGAAAYLFLFLSDVPGAQEERFGTLSALPEDLGRWVREKEPKPDGLLCERRQLLDETSGGKIIILQVRYRDPKTKKIERIEPEKRMKRSRRRS